MDPQVKTAAEGRPTPRRIAITGATGQLGRHVLAEIAAWPDTRILTLVRPGCQWVPPGANVEVVPVDFHEGPTLPEALERFQPDCIVHCATAGMQLPRPAWSEMVRFNVNVSLRLCELAARIPGCHLVHVSTGLAYRDDGRVLREDSALESQHPYAATKIAAEVLVRAAAADLQVSLTVVRPFAFSGPGDSGSRLFPSLLRTAADGGSMDLSPGSQIRDHCAVSDIAAGIALAVLKRAELPPGIQIFNLGSGVEISLRETIERVVSELGLKVRLNFGARNYAPFEPQFLVADTARAQQLLGWRPRVNFAHAIWQLARESWPALLVVEPRERL